MIDWRQWFDEPAAVAALVLAGWLYALLAGPFRPRIAPGEPRPRAAALRFYGGLGLLYVAAGSPLARIGGLYLFSVHVALQLVVVYPGAALVVTGLPPWMADAVLARPFVRRVAAPVLRPWFCGAAFVLMVSAWYRPRLLEFGLENGCAHALENAGLFAAAALFWWPLASPSRIFPPAPVGVRMLYLSALEVALAAVFSYILMAEHPMYPTYGFAPRLVPGLDALDDQVLGGVLLAGASSLVLLGALGVNFHRWTKESGR